jgi:prolipoprotein diacylglyceryltransferase
MTAMVIAAINITVSVILVCLVRKKRNTRSECPFMFLFAVCFERSTVDAIPVIKKSQKTHASIVEPITSMNLGKAGIINIVSEEIKKLPLHK